jgi:hypothetical protein
MSGSISTSSVSIANRALAAIGTRSTISSFTEGSNESNNVSLIYAPVRQQLLRAAQWNFAKATAVLSLLKAAPGTPENPISTATTWVAATMPPPGWAYSYAYPQDCLAMRKAVPNLYITTTVSAVPIFPSGATSTPPYWIAPGQKFEVATDFDTSGNFVNVVLTSCEGAIGCYTRDISVETLWDADFTEAMVSALAGKLALSLTGDKALAKMRFDEANKMLLDARASNGNESMVVYDHTPDWITAGHGCRWMASGIVGAGYFSPFGPLFDTPGY